MNGTYGSIIDGLGDLASRGSAGRGEEALDGVAMHAELACDRADRPLLDVIQAQDLRAGLLVDGHLTPFPVGRSPG